MCLNVLGMFMCVKLSISQYADAILGNNGGNIHQIRLDKSCVCAVWSGASVGLLYVYRVGVEMP